MLSQVTNFLKNNKKIMYYLGFFAIVYFVLGDSVFANNAWEWETSKVIQETISLINYVFKFLSILLGILTNFVWLFLNPSWTNGTVLGLQVHLKELWILVSNVVYFIFAILIIVIAFMNILWKWDKWELKQALPKFIVWVLIVPFSWFLVQFIISISSILTASVLSIPHDVLSKNSTINKQMSAMQICTHIFITDSEKNKDSKKENKSVLGNCKDEDRENVNDIMTWNTAFGILNIYTYGIFELDQAQLLFPGDIETSARSWTDLAFKTIFNVIVVLIYWILVVTLAMALIVRGIWLWVYMIFSPVFWLLYFFGKDKDWFMDGKFSLTELIGLAFVPVYVAGALSFGLLFIFVAGQWGQANWTNLIFDVSEWTDSSGSGTVIVKMMDTYTVEMWGTVAASASPIKTVWNVLDWFKWSLGTLIMQLFWLVILWASVIIALSQSKIRKQLLNQLQNLGNLSEILQWNLLNMHQYLVGWVLDECKKYELCLLVL